MTYENVSSSLGQEANYIKLFNALPGNHLLLLNDAPHYTILAATPLRLKETGMQAENVIGKGIFEAHPSNVNDPQDTGVNNLSDSLAYVLQHKEAHQLPIQRYDLKGEDGRFIEYYWSAGNSPVLDDEGNVAYIIHTATNITEQVRADQKMTSARSIEKAYDFFMSTPVLTGVLKGDDYIIELANEGLLEVWNRTSDIVGQPLLKAIPELEAQGLIQLLDQVRITGQSFYAYEYPITLLRNGKEEVLYFDFVYKAYYEDGYPGKANSIIGVGHEVTTQVLAKKKIEESEAKYRTLFDSMDQGICVMEMIYDEQQQPVDYRFLETNPVFEKQTGLKDALGKTARELVPNLEQHWIELYDKVARTGEAIRFTEGSAAMERWFDVFAFRIGDSESPKVALLFTNITERKKAEEAILQSESNLRNMILQSPVAMCILDGSSFIVEVANERILALWGKSREEIMGKPVFEILIEAGEQGLKEVMQLVYQTGERFVANEMPVRLPREEKIETFYLNFVYEPLRGTDGIIKGIMAVAIDVSDQVLARRKIEEIVAQRTSELAKANEALAASNRELARSNVNLGEFAYAASHDLKEPIRKIHFFSERIKNLLRDRMNEEEHRYFERMEGAAKRMASLIDDLLSFSQISIRPQSLEDVDMNQLLQIVLDDLDLEIEQKGAQVTVDSLFTIKGHHRQLQQAFQNLLTNALKYNRPGVSPQVRVTCQKMLGGEAGLVLSEAEQRRNYYCLSIQDNGIGFEQDDAERIFNVFTRLHGMTEYKGSGIGLSIVRKVIENHNGYIWAQGKLGVGATFHILFPEESATLIADADKSSV